MKIKNILVLGEFEDLFSEKFLSFMFVFFSSLSYCFVRISLNLFIAILVFVFQNVCSLSCFTEDGVCVGLKDFPWLFIPDENKCSEYDLSAEYIAAPDSKYNCFQIPIPFNSYIPTEVKTITAFGGESDSNGGFISFTYYNNEVSQILNFEGGSDFIVQDEHKKFTVSSSKILGMRAKGNGGALYSKLIDFDFSFSELSIENCSAKGSGGALYMEGVLVCM
jgi:hypothetical protein